MTNPYLWTEPLSTERWQEEEDEKGAALRERSTLGDALAELKAAGVLPLSPGEGAAELQELKALAVRPSRPSRGGPVNPKAGPLISRRAQPFRGAPIHLAARPTVPHHTGV